MFKYMKRQSPADNIFDTIVIVLSLLILLIIVYPLWFVVIASFSDSHMLNLGRVWLWPRGFTFIGYEWTFADSRIWLGYRNTVFYTIAGTAFSLLFTLPAAYALSRKDFPGRNFFMMFFVFTMFFGGGLIPTFLTVRSFSLVNTIWVLLIPFSVSIYHLIISRTFFASNIPLELLESAKMDGCSNTRFFVQIVLPLSKAIVAVIALYCAVSQWNQFFLSLIYVRNRNLIPLQMVLREILLASRAYEDSIVGSNTEYQRAADIMKYSVIIVATLPVMCFYPFIQKYFAKGVMIGSIKG